MNANRITETLDRLFIEENHRIVFWYDADREFEESLDALNLDGVNVLRRDKLSALEIKIRVELDEPATHFLIYTPTPEPAFDDNALLDIQLYSRTFRADIASVRFEELGLNDQSLREHLAARKTFLRSTDRVARLKRFVQSNDREAELDRKMIAVSVRADQPEIAGILLRLFNEFCIEGECDLNQIPAAWSDIEKYSLADSFWALMRETFGYDSTAPRLADLLLRLFVTDFRDTLRGELPAALRHFALPRKDASVLLSSWRKNTNYTLLYDALARHVEVELKLEQHFANLEPEQLIEVETFGIVDREIVRHLRDRIIKNLSRTLPQRHRDTKQNASIGFVSSPRPGIPVAEPDLDALRHFVVGRLDKHWARESAGQDTGQDTSNAFRHSYQALLAAAELFTLRETYQAGFAYPSAEAMYAAYTTELYRFDGCYRNFNFAADAVEAVGWNLLHDLRGRVEACYGGWYMDQLAKSWGAYVEGEGRDGGLLAHWRIDGVPNQQDFYRTHVAPLLASAPNSKVYVIISDAFRYEAAAELARRLVTSRTEVELSSQLGVLPSYTALGMAALLPHTALRIKATASLDILADEISTGSFEKRREILGNVGGVCVRADELLKMKKDAGREFVREQRVIYVYHNQIDSTGDQAATETRTFQAVYTCLDELQRLVTRIINDFNGSQIFITADHGFLFQHTAPNAADRSELITEPTGTLRAKKRYLLGTNLGTRPNVLAGQTKQTTGADGDIEFWIPRGANRFHFVGGARFVHGGAMPQEIVVPVIRVHSLRGSAAESAVLRKVGVSLLGSVRRVVNNVQRFEFIQTEPVSERVRPLTLLISLCDPSRGDAKISNEVTITFDSASSNIDERKRTAQLIIQGGAYDKRQDYALVLRDAETHVEYNRETLTIDLAFTSDF